MSLVREKYEVLCPRLSCLSDEVVLALAWKKASAYVRRHNWYADTLELDASGLNLETLTSTWSTEVLLDVYEPRPARLVPAPKNGRWEFREGIPGGWAPAPLPDDPDATPVQALRPLAHVGIREQTVAAAVMLCLADCIETAQGNPAVRSIDALSKGVFSYGNRLYCRWNADNSQAHFSWGSSDTYSRYAADYQQFVNRPREVAAALERELDNDGTRVFVVKLDISSYYDRIKLPKLIEKLQEEYERYRGDDASRQAADADFWHAAERAITFEWFSADDTLKGLLKGGELPNGLPQGLMASGFLANAYLMDFDRAVGESCRRPLSIDVGDSESKVTIHDYCRYVDDLRLVVSTDAPELELAELQTDITAWVQRKLDRSIGDPRGASTLTINALKTEIENLSQVANASSVASRMRQVQQQLST